MGRPRLPDPIEPINIMPLMNIIMLLIPFLIMSTEFIKLGVINVTAPKIGSSSSDQKQPEKKPEKPPLNLTVSVTDKGMTLITRGDKQFRKDARSTSKREAPKKLPTIKKNDQNKHNFRELTDCLNKIKKLFPEEKRIIIMAEPEIKYEVIISLMDSSRTSKEYPENIKESKEGLFPEVILSAGVL